MSSNILLNRQHAILAERGEQLRINTLAYHGGVPYITERLCRWPSESDIDFFGSNDGQLSQTQFLNSGTNSTVGRKERAFLTNYARRIAEKINQYVFQSTPVREGLDPMWAADVTRTGISLNQFMTEISALMTVCRWCWVGVDRPATQGPRSKADVERSGDKVYWQLYAPNEVVDWSFDARGNLLWLLLEREVYTNSNPREPAVKSIARYLYEPGKMTTMIFNDKKDEFSAVTETPSASMEIPFHLVGVPSEKPWWFDDVEKVQRTIMDLHSSLDTAIFKSVFPLLVVSSNFQNSMMMEQISSSEVRKKIGMGNPISETAEESGITRWLSGTTADLTFIRAEIDRRSSELYDIVGMAMQMPESRQVASAEAKAWDHLDIETVLAQRATALEETETRLIELSQEIGGTIFTPYTAAYAKKFDLSDFITDMQGITQAANFSLPIEGEKMLKKAALKSAGKRFNVEQSELDEALAAVDAMEDVPPLYTPPQPSPDNSNDGNQDQDQPPG